MPVWYPNFEEHTIETMFLKAPESFLQYLLSDEGLFLPESVCSTISDDLVIPTTDSNSLDIPNSSSSENGARTKLILQSQNFQDFHKQVDDVIKTIGGKVFPKMNWSSPRDAAWIAMNNSLCCENFIDICLLMKSSDFITHDLTTPFQLSLDANTDTRDRVDYTLVLRKWVDIAPSGEYRCFVKDGKLFAASQRHMQHFPFIGATKESIVKKLKRFFKRHIKDRFPERDYTFDVYLAGSSSADLLIDFNPFVEVTDSLLFSWPELTGADALPEDVNGELVDGVVFRFVPPEGTVCYVSVCTLQPVKPGFL